MRKVLREESAVKIWWCGREKKAPRKEGIVRRRPSKITVGRWYCVTRGRHYGKQITVVEGILSGKYHTRIMLYREGTVTGGTCNNSTVSTEGTVGGWYSDKTLYEECLMGREVMW